MMKRHYIGIMILTLGLAGCAKEPTNNNSSMIIMHGEEIAAVYRNGENITTQYVQRVENTYQIISDFLNRDISELQFRDYCRLGDEGATVEVLINNERYLCVLYDNEPLLSIKRIN